MSARAILWGRDSPVSEQYVPPVSDRRVRRHPFLVPEKDTIACCSATFFAALAIANRTVAAPFGLTVVFALQIAIATGSARADSRFFPLPATLPPVLAPVLAPAPEELVGMTLQLVDSEDPLWIVFHANGVLASIDERGKPFTGARRIDRAGCLCLKSRIWWRQGSCFTLYGRSHDALDGVVPLRFPDTLLPASPYPTVTN